MGVPFGQVKNAVKKKDRDQIFRHTKPHFYPWLSYASFGQADQ
jgi:hypothetical protein